MTEVLCDGMPPVIDRATAREYQCTRGSDCPADSYCHLQFGKCCQEGILNKWCTDREKVIYKTVWGSIIDSDKGFLEIILK